MATQTTRESPIALTSAVQPVGLLQRKCDCGQHTIAGGECDDCGKKQLSLQCANRNSKFDTRNSDSTLSIVSEVIRSPGALLDGATSAFFEPRFGHDFARVQARSSKSVAAAARTANERVDSVRRPHAGDLEQHIAGLFEMQ